MTLLRSRHCRFSVFFSVALYITFVSAVPHSASCNVATRGAKGHGVDDTVALQAVLDDPSCQEVLLPENRTFSASTLFVRRSDVAITIEAGATLAGLPAEFRRQRPDCLTESGLEFNWQNWCALLRVQSERNFKLRGPGTIAPGGVGGRDPDFYSAIHVQSTEGVQVSGRLRVKCTAWWWCTVLHNASDVHVSGLFVDGSGGRDGMDLVNCRRVLLEDSLIEGSDDALCFKTIKNNGLASFPSHDITVRRSRISSTWCNAIQFGSATEVDMSNFTFADIEIKSARKSAIGVVTMDGANITNVAFSNITISGWNVATPLYVKVGNRVECEDNKGSCFWPGSIALLSFSGVKAIGWGNASDPKPGHRPSYTATIEGLNATHRRVGPLRFEALTLSAPGGGEANDSWVDPPHKPLDYQPRLDGVRPSFGLFVRYAHDIAVVGSDISVGGGGEDGRPAIVADQVAGLSLIRVRVASAAG